MGVVYLARDTALDRKVAIKSIYSASAESETQQLRLMREAKAAGALSHPHIATVYDVFDDQGSTYIVMEYVAGASIAATIAELPPGRTLPPDTALRIVRQTASALDYAHAQGIIHRDIKPANLLLDQHGSVKVVDFGIAKMADSNTDLTHGAPIGTVAYMSPEQINSESLTGRADQFSLAATAYVLFAGKPMFPQAETISSLMFKNCFEQPVPVSAVKFGLPQALDDALARGLAKKAPERFTTCAELAAACDRAFQNPVTTTPLPLVADAGPKPKTGRCGVVTDGARRNSSGCADDHVASGCGALRRAGCIAYRGSWGFRNARPDEHSPSSYTGKREAQGAVGSSERKQGQGKWK